MISRKTGLKLAPWVIVIALALIWEALVIDLPRPRELDVTYTEPFAAHVHELRSHIGHIRAS